MRRLVLHITVALLAFVVGVSAAALLGVFKFRGGGERGYHKRAYVERHGPRGRTHDCPRSRGMQEFSPLPPPPPPAFDLPAVPPAPPLPPAAVPRPGEAKRFRIRGEDGRERVIVLQQSADVS